MSITQNPPPSNLTTKLFAFPNPSISPQNPSMISTTVFRSLTKQAISRTQRLPLKPLLGFCQRSDFFQHPILVSSCSTLVGSCQIDHMQRPSFGFSDFCPNGYASVAEAISSTDASSSTDAEEEVCVVDELQEILKEMKKEDKRQSAYRWRIEQARVRGMGEGKYLMLRRRQIKIETEAWERAADEYRELLMDMCEQKLAPNLPYMKSLFLGWFEPLCNAITMEQDLCRQGKNKTSYGPYMDKLPADMMAVITMHKLMGLLTGEHGSCRVVSAVCTIGEAIEQEVKIHNFLERTKKKKVGKDQETGESDAAMKENEKLNKKVTNLMKKQKMQAVRHIVRGHDDSKAWSQEAKAKVGSHLIELLTQSAFIQPPADQLGDSLVDIRPAFVHTFKTVSNAKNTSRRYGVIECDPLVLKGLERTIKTSLQILTLQRETEKIMVKRQRTAFPPNFVHSLDGSHMMITAVACKKAGLNFAEVHDSYWTHACDVDVMNRILREKFVELYETPILERLLESFQQSFPTLTFPPLPERGDFELRDVLESPYFFN